VPVLAAGAAGQLAALLAACDTVVSGLLNESPQTVVCVGSGPLTRRFSDTAWGTLAGYGVAVEAPARHDDGEEPELPLSLTIGRWLLDRVGWSGDVLLQTVDSGRAGRSGSSAGSGSSAADCAELGRALEAEAGSQAVWLVLGDGTNRRGPSSPGHDDPRAPGFDALVADALARADLDAILGLDAGLAAELGVGGRAAWQVLAGGVQATHSAEVPGAFAATIESAVHYDAAPFGVEYLVADWRFR
jgi:hypothetical protein